MSTKNTLEVLYARNVLKGLSTRNTFKKKTVNLKYLKGSKWWEKLYRNCKKETLLMSTKNS